MKIMRSGSDMKHVRGQIMDARRDDMDDDSLAFQTTADHEGGGVAGDGTKLFIDMRTHN